jgi:hypothetical protein
LIVVPVFIKHIEWRDGATVRFRKALFASGHSRLWAGAAGEPELIALHPLTMM